MKKRFAKLAAILLSSAMTLTMIPTNFVYAKDVDTTAVQTEASFQSNMEETEQTDYRISDPVLYKERLWF